uniref:Replication factor C subunit 4 (Trinotate prediction) n=1 Tax=Myxobolus squamalis TaxID=59785 RepID=A0A6B2G1M1_MYXSQ
MSITLGEPKKTSNFFKKPVENGQAVVRVVPWIEKYRPKSINEIASQTEVVLFFTKVLETNDLPNMLFYGPPGTGKTSSILALARDLFGFDKLKNRVLELNASDERGIQVIRDKVKAFAQLSVGQTYHKLTKSILPPYKLIVLDEADNMTSSAQAALRRLMESSLSTTRFCLICNYVTKIIDPIISRCSSFYFKPLSPNECLSRLIYIRDQENLSISTENLEFLVNYSDGDLRKAIMRMQSCRYYINTINKQDLIEICGIIPEEFAVRIYRLLDELPVETIQDISRDFYYEGYSLSKFMVQFQEYILTCSTIQDTQKAQILIKLSDVDKMLSDGADEFLQLMSILSHVVKVTKDANQ